MRQNMAQNYMMGAGMVPPTAPTPPSQLSFKSDPNQRMQFKSFMQGLSAPQAPMAPPMAPQMMPMPQIPVPMQNIDVFSQPVQNMANGGRASRPQDRAKRAEEGRAVARRIFSRPERDDDRRRGGILNRPTTNKQIAEANAIAAALSSSKPSDKYGSGSDAKTVAELAGKPSTSQLPSRRTDSFDPNYITELLSSGLTNVDAMSIVPPVYDRISELDAEDGPPVDPRRSGLGSTLSQQIAALRGDELPTTPEIQGIGFEDVPDDETFLPITQTPQDVNLLADSFLTRLPFGIGSYIADNQMDQLGTFMNIPGSQYDYELGKGVAPAGQGTLNISPSGVVTYTGRRDPNYTGPFANLINPQARPEREVNPCPPGYTLVNGACMPISQPIAQATPATPAPNVISNIPVTTAAPSPVVQSTAPPAQLGMPLGQPSPIQPMNQFLTNIPNSLNLAANNFLSALSS